MLYLTSAGNKRVCQLPFPNGSSVFVYFDTWADCQHMADKASKSTNQCRSRRLKVMASAYLHETQPCMEIAWSVLESQSTSWVKTPSVKFIWLLTCCSSFKMVSTSASTHRGLVNIIGIPCIASQTRLQKLKQLTSDIPSFPLLMPEEKDANADVIGGILLLSPSSSRSYCQSPKQFRLSSCPLSFRRHSVT